MTVTQTAPLYSAGAELAVSATFAFPAGRTLQSLVWVPALPAGWTLLTATGDGQPEVDPDGRTIAFLGVDLSAHNPLSFTYRVRVPADDTGPRVLEASVEYQLDGMFNPEPVAPPALALADADARHALEGYLAGEAQTVTCSFAYPQGRQLVSLLWRPELPAGWQVTGVDGQGGPDLDPNDGSIVFLGDLAAGNPLVFTYTVTVPSEQKGNQALGGGIEFQLNDMFNYVTARAMPDPLTVRPLHTLSIATPFGAGEPPAGTYTNFYGTPQTNRVSASDTVGLFTYGCAGWLLTGNEPVSGTGTEIRMVLTNNAALTWVWVAPAVGPRSVNEMETLAFQAAVAYTEPAFEPLSLSYALDAASVARGMSITAAGAFAWTPTEEQGGQSYPVTVTVTDAGVEPHGLAASETFTVTVAEVNRKPTLAALADRLADAQSTLTFTATATDPDLPQQALVFSLDAASLALGMTIDPVSGVFSWSPTVEQAGVAGQSYTVSVTVMDAGANPAAQSDTKSFTIYVSDSRGTHETFGYLAGRTAEIVCTFAYPASRPLESLLWRPALPAGWTLAAVAGDGTPEVDPNDGTVVFTGSLANNPVTFRYWVAVPAGVTGPQTLRAEAEYQVQGMFNPVVVPIYPDPLTVPELHTFEVVSAEGQCVPAPGVYTNLHGTPLAASVSTPLVRGTRTFACTGWTMTGIEPASGPGDSVAMTLTQDAVLTWNWVAPLIAPAGAVAVTMDEDNAPIFWVQPALSASEPYRPELVSQLAWSLLAPASHGTATVSGTGASPVIGYVPQGDWYGSDSFEVQVADGLGGLDHVTVTVTVSPVNDAPLLASIGDQRTDERTPLAFTVSASDVDQSTQPQTLRYSMTGAPAGATLDPVTGAFAWTPTAGQAGADFATFSVTVTVQDDGTYPDAQTDSETFTITLDSSRATHSAVGYRAGQPLTVDCTFAYPATTGRQLFSLLWRPELPAGWELVGASGDGAPEIDPIDQAVVFTGGFPPNNPLTFSYVVMVPPGQTGPQPVGGLIEYQMDGMANPATVRAQPDPFVVPMLVTLPDLAVADKVYDGLTNATVSAYGALSGVVSGDDVQLVTTGAWAFFDTPTVGASKVVTVGGLSLAGADAALYSIDVHTVTAAVTQATLTVTADPQTKTYGDANPPLTFQYSGFVNGESAAVLDTAPTASTSVTPLTGVGTHVGAITVSGGADVNYAFTYVPADFTVEPRSATVVADAKTKTYGDANPELTAVVGGTVNGDAINYTLSTTAGQFSDVGSYPITVSLGENPNYNVSVTDAVLAIGKAPSATAVTINGGPFVYTGAAVTPATVSVTGAGGLNLAPEPVYANNVNAGTATASYGYAGDANHEPSADSKNFAIGKADAAIAVTGAEVVYDGAAHGATGTATSADGVTDLTALLDLGASFTDVPGGTAEWTFAGDANHNVAGGTVQIVIGKAPSATAVTINGGPFTYSGAAVTPATVSVTGAGGLNLAPAPVYANNVNAGTATASYGYAGDANHEPSADSKDFVIGKADATIAVAGAEVVYDGAAHGATGTATSADGVTDLTALLDLGASFTDVPGGTAEWTFAGDANHNVAAGTAQIVIGKAPSATAVTINGGPFTYTGAAVTPATVSVTGAGGLDLAPEPVYANNVNAGTATASYGYAGDANHEPSADSEAFEIDRATLTITGSFTAADKMYDGTTAATISANRLTLATPADGDDVALTAVAAFETKDVGSGKTVSLAESTLTGADTANYTLSLAGAPTTTADILFPAVSCTQACNGFRSPSAATVISGTFSVPDGETLMALTWRPALPAGWALVSAAGDGAPAVNGSGEIVFAGPFNYPTVLFTYTVAIPGDERVTNYVGAAATFRLGRMADALTSEGLPPPLLMKRYHSADYLPPYWKITSLELSRFKSYIGKTAYYVSSTTVDGFHPSVGVTEGGKHSADYVTPYWRLTSLELSRVKSLMNAGAYDVDPTRPDGYSPRSN